MIRRPPRSTLSSSSAASDVYKRQVWRKRCAGVGDAVRSRLDIVSPVLWTCVWKRKCFWEEKIRRGEGAEEVLMCCDAGPARAHRSNATNTAPAEPRCQNIPDAHDVCSHAETQAMLKRMRRARSPVVGKGSARPFGQGRTALSAIFKHRRHRPKPGAKEKQCWKKGRARHETKVLVPLQDCALKAPR